MLFCLYYSPARGKDGPSPSIKSILQFPWTRRSWPGHCNGKLLSPHPTLQSLLPSQQVSITRWRVWWWITPRLPYSCGIQPDKRGKISARLSGGREKSTCSWFLSLGKLSASEGPDRFMTAIPVLNLQQRSVLEISRSCGCEAGPGEIALRIYRKVDVSDLHACGSKQSVHRCMSWASKGGKDCEPFQIWFSCQSQLN